MKYMIAGLWIVVGLLFGIQLGTHAHIKTIEKQLSVLTDQAVLAGKMSAKIDEYNAKVKEHNQKMLKN